LQWRAQRCDHIQPQDGVVERAQEEIKAAVGLDVFYCSADATDEAQVEALLEDAKRQLGGKGGLSRKRPGLQQKIDALDFDIDVFRQMLEANVTSFMITLSTSAAI
jgi:NAD(P)-dependent dehydrogenase (short-subunit alcohol dehydrogenase family)